MNFPLDPYSHYGTAAGSPSPQAPPVLQSLCLARAQVAPGAAGARGAGEALLPRQGLGYAFRTVNHHVDHILYI